LVNASLCAQKAFEYPAAPKDSIVDIYHGVTVIDDYRYLENSQDDRTILWLEQQEKVTGKYSRKLLALSNIRQWVYQIYDTEFKPFEKEEKELIEANKPQFKKKFKSATSPPDLYYKRGEHDFFRRLVNGKDHKQFKDDNVIITDYVMSNDYKYATVELSHSGRDWREAFIYDLETGEQLADTIKYIGTLDPVWTGNGFYYIRFDKPEAGKELLNVRTGERLCYHAVNTKQETDKIVFRNPDKENIHGMGYSIIDSANIMLSYPRNIKDKWYTARAIVDISDVENFIPQNFLISPDQQGVFYDVEAIYGDSLIIRSNLGSPNKRVLVCDKTQLNKISELIPEYQDNLINVNRLGKDMIACIYTLDGVYSVLLFNLKGELLKSIAFPVGKSVSGFYAEDDDTHSAYEIHSFFHPSIKYNLNLETLGNEAAGELFIPYRHDKLKTVYVTYKSKDGTEIPMYLTYAKDLALDGTNPTLIYGYGGYGITVQPSYKQEHMVWLLNGGILAIPNVRGGGAKGVDWANAGKGLNKQHAIDDFIAAAEYLQNNDYTNPLKTAIAGGSHGGMLVGAALTQRPELYKAAIPSAGVYDMLRFEKFTVGHVATNFFEFGSVADSLDFHNLLSYSPLHNVRQGVKYPSILVVTGNNDDRVPPLHSYKFLAMLQEKGDHSSPYILKIKQGTGHQGALTVEDYLNGISYRYNFLFNELKIKLKDRVN
jgi:prolyl oligopeptidase